MAARQNLNTSRIKDQATSLSHINTHAHAFAANQILRVVNFARASQQLTGLNYRLDGLAVKVYASRAEDPGIDSRLRRGDFSGSTHTSDLNIGIPVATLHGAWRYTGSGQPGVSIL